MNPRRSIKIGLYFFQPESKIVEETMKNSFKPGLKTHQNCHSETKIRNGRDKIDPWIEDYFTNKKIISIHPSERLR